MLLKIKSRYNSRFPPSTKSSAAPSAQSLTVERYGLLFLKLGGQFGKPAARRGSDSGRDDLSWLGMLYVAGNVINPRDGACGFVEVED
jgi:hypothetical protein